MALADEKYVVLTVGDGTDSPAISGAATVVRSGRAYDETLAKVRRKYGWRGRLSSTDAVLILRLE